MSRLLHQPTRSCNGRNSSLPETLLALWVAAVTLLALPCLGAGTNLILWDTSAPLGSTLNIDDRAAWKPVPSDLLTLEADPPKASSDPGYYGREYSFKGDAVVENHSVTAVFSSASGRVTIFSRNDPASQAPMPAVRIVEIVPLQMKTQSVTINRSAIVRNAGDEVALEISFSAKGAQEVSAQFLFGKGSIVDIKPSEKMKGLSLRSTIDYGIVPGFIGDDVVFAPADYPSLNTLSLPSENVFLGLLKGEQNEFLLAWPKGKQQISLQLSNDPEGKRLIEAIDFENDGQSLYLAALAAPGLWHKEPLSASYLEKDAPIKWKRPFPAKWKTQLLEENVKTTFAFKPSKAQIWRGVPGSYTYPVWFDNDAASFHLSKKVPPKGESLIYFVEGQDTPAAFDSPVDLMQAALGRPICDPILDLPGRKLRTHHRRGGDGVRRACTCGCTEAIQAVFESGQEVAKKDSVQEELDDMIYFVHRHVERIDEYTHFAEDLIKFLKAQQSAAPELKPYLDSLEEIAREIPQQRSLQTENMKSFGYADDLARQTLALCSKKDATNLKAYMDLLKAWRAMGGAQDYVLAQCHTIARKLCQEAAYSAVPYPKAAALAREIRARCRQCLRNPDGYEIWADY